MNTPRGVRYEGGPVVIQVIEGANPPVQISLSASAGAHESQSALLGVSLEMLLRRKLALQIERRPLRAGGGIISRQTEGRLTTIGGGTAQLELVEDRGVRGELRDSRGQVTALEGTYALSCWVLPETLGGSGNGSGSPGMIERVEDEDFQSEFCKRVADLR